MLSGNCTEALSIQATITISCSSAKLIKNGIAPLPCPLPALLKQHWYIKRGERVRVRGRAQFYATLGFILARAHQSSGRGDRSWDRIVGIVQLRLASRLIVASITGQAGSRESNDLPGCACAASIHRRQNERARNQDSESKVGSFHDGSAGRRDACPTLVG